MLDQFLTNTTLSILPHDKEPDLLLSLIIITWNTSEIKNATRLNVTKKCKKLKNAVNSAKKKF